jgi:hypothetical protein
MATSTVSGQNRKDVGHVPKNIVLRYVVDFFRCYQRVMEPCSDGKDSNSIFSGLPSMLFQESIKPPAPGFFPIGISINPLLEFHRSLTCSKQRLQFVRAKACASRIPQDSGTIVIPCFGVHFVTGRHDCQVGIASHVVEIEEDWDLDCVPVPRSNFPTPCILSPQLWRAGGIPYPLTVFQWSKTVLLLGLSRSFLEKFVEGRDKVTDILQRLGHQPI